MNNQNKYIKISIKIKLVYKYIVYLYKAFLITIYGEERGER